MRASGDPDSRGTVPSWCTRRRRGRATCGTAARGRSPPRGTGTAGSGTGRTPAKKRYFNQFLMSKFHPVSCKAARSRSPPRGSGTAESSTGRTPETRANIVSVLGVLDFLCRQIRAKQSHCKRTASRTRSCVTALRKKRFRDNKMIRSAPHSSRFRLIRDLKALRLLLEDGAHTTWVPSFRRAEEE